MEYNAAQESAVKAIHGPVMVISCPGSGKTTTMLRRVREMISQGIPDEEILVVTFTDAAANEMKSRYAVQYGDCDTLFCTIHSFCFMVLKQYAGASMYRVLDPVEQFEILTRAMSTLSEKTYATKKDILSDISFYKNNRDKFSPRSLEMDQFQKIYEAYELEKHISGCIDFDDMLIECRDLLRSKKDILTELHKHYKYVMCDEYQDTNNIQKDILYMLAGEERNIFVVGDDDQSIYGFRGANPGIMMDFELDFPGCRKITMDYNYRSEKEIIETANELIAYNTMRYPKEFKAVKDGVGKVEYDAYKNRRDEVDNLAQLVRKLSSGGNYSEIAILARTNLQLVDIADALQAMKIPYHTQEHIPDVFENFIFGDMVSYLRLMEGTGIAKDFMRVLNRPGRGFREAEFAGLSAVNEYTVTKVTTRFNFTGDQDKAIKFIRDIESCRNLPFQKKVEKLVDLFGYNRYVQTYASRTNVDPSIIQGMFEFLYDDARKANSTKEWLKRAEQHIQEHRRKETEAVQNGVTLSTMHRAKGLEWDTVILPDCCQGISPLANSKLLSEMEEERRLFYVAVTRARKNLYVMSYSEKTGKGGKVGPVKPSQFIAEMRGDMRRMTEKKDMADKQVAEAREKANNGFIEGPPIIFKNGMHVTHKTYGRGVVVRKSMIAVTVRFGNENKIFKI